MIELEQQDENSTSAVEVHKLVIISANNILADISRVSDESNHGALLTSLEFIADALCHFPEMFIPSHRDILMVEHKVTDESCCSSQQVIENQPSYILSNWVTNHLLRILTVPGSTVVHAKALTVLENILLTAAGQNPFIFRLLAVQFIECLGELCKIFELFHVEQRSQFTPKISQFDTSAVELDSTEHPLTYRPLTLADAESCQRLQISITSVLSHIYVQLSIYVGDRLYPVDNTGNCVVLWPIAVCQIEYGEVELKTVSLTLVSILLNSGLPAFEILNYLVNCLAALTSLLCSGFNSCEGDYDQLEISLSNVINKLSDVLLTPDDVDSLSVSCIIDTLCTAGIVQAIVTYGLTKLRTSQLQCALGRCLSAALRVTGYQPDIHETACCRLVEEIGVEIAGNNYKYTIDVIRQAIVCEVFNNAACVRLHCTEFMTENVWCDLKSTEPDESSLMTSSASSKKIPSKALHSSSMLSENSSIAAHLMHRLDSLLLELESDCKSCEHQLAGVEHIVNLLTCCCFTCRWLSKATNVEICRTDNVTSVKPSLVSRLVSVSARYLELCCDVSRRAEIDRVYCSIVHIAGAVLCVYDLEDIGADELSQFVEILSVPWLASEVSWKDLKVRNNQHYVKVSSSIAEQLCVEVIVQCLELLSLLPRQFCNRWRKQVICKAMGDHREAVRAAGVTKLPYLLHNLGPSSYHLITDVIHGMTNDASDVVKESIASMVGITACVISSYSVLQRCLSGSDSRVQVKLSCTSCCDRSQSSDSSRSKSAAARTSAIDSAAMLVSTVKSLCSAESKTVKLKLISGLESLFRHVWSWTGKNIARDAVIAALLLQRDSCYEVRIALCRVVRHVVASEKVNEESQTNSLIKKELENFGEQGFGSQVPAEFAETTLTFAGEIARVATDELLLTCIVVLLNAVLFPLSPLLEATALHQMKQLAVTRKKPPRHLFMQFGHHISEAIACCLHDSKKAKPNWDPTVILKKVADVFSFDDVLTLLKSTQHFLLPHLVKKASPAASALIKAISRMMENPNHKKVIDENFGHIYCHLVCSCVSDREMQTVINYLEAEMELPLNKLLAIGKQIDSLLVVHLSSSYDQVLNGLWALLKARNSLDGPEYDTRKNDQLVSMLQPNLLGILVYFNKFLNDATRPIIEKRKAYKSLILLMTLMGSSHVTSVRMHIMTSLKIGLQYEDAAFAKLCCKAWDCFVHTLEQSVLGSMLSQIVVSLLPLLQKLPDKVARIFHFLVVDNREKLQQHLRELYFLPDRPELTAVNAALKPYVDALFNGKDLNTLIQHLIKGVTHESLDVRQMALSKLAQSLRSNQDMLLKLILNRETPDPIVSQLVTVLLNGCRETDPATRILFGECLGEIGAIDPGRLELLTNEPKDELTRFISSMCDDSFAFELVNELAKAFLRAEDRTAQDYVAFAIQELIRIYDIRLESSDCASGGSNSNSTSAGKLWKRFTPEVHEILTPLTQSRYMLKIISNASTSSHPIYGSRKGSTFEAWVCALTSCLGSKLKQDKCRRVFESCRGVVGFGADSHIALFLLPHFTVQVLLDGTDIDRQELLEELMAVLNDVKIPDSRSGPPTDLRHMAAQTVFYMLDHLAKWARHRLTAVALQSGVSTASTTRPSSSSSDLGVLAAVANDRNYSELKSFMDLVPQDVLAIASYNCGVYTRACMHHEQFVRRTMSSGARLTTESLDFLLKLYVALDEPDGVAGVMAIQQSSPSLAQQILAFESVGRLSDASVCYELAIQSHPDELPFRCGVLKNELALGKLSSVLDVANAMIIDSPHWAADLNVYRIEAAWRLGQWDKLQSYVKTETSQGWNVGLGRLLVAAKLKDETSFRTNLQQIRLEQITPLSAASMEAGTYQRGYESILRLHMLNDLEEGLKVLLGFPASAGCPVFDKAAELPSLLSRWKRRLECCQSSYRYQDPILNLHRVILRLAKEDGSINVNREIGECWLQSARVARECQLIQTAHSSLLNAAEYNLPDFFLEKAKWLWDKGDADLAQSCLERAIDEMYRDKDKFKTSSSAATTTTMSESMLAARLNCARMMLQLGRYCDETARWESNAVVRHLKEVTQVNSEWEDGYFYVATYFDKVSSTLCDRGPPGDMVVQMVQNFGQSLLYGSQYIYQSMPRMLSLWLDFGAEVVAAESSDKSEAVRIGMKSTLATLNRLMSSFAERLAPYQFFVVFPQLISRICHAHPEVFAQLKVIIANLLKEFPQQSVWMMMAVSKSSYQMRVQRCVDIFSRAKQLRPDLARFLGDMTKLVDKLLDLCNRQDGGGAMSVSTLSISMHFKPLQRLLDDKDFSAILLPLQSQMTPSLPPVSVVPSAHLPFASTGAVHLQGIEDTIEVLASLQRPKKVTFKGSDGKRYPMLCKPKDDLRKDARLMEFNGIVNRCLRHDAESRRRDLHIRTFTVTPLNEECGLLEWVLNTNGLRPVMMKLYKERGLYMSGKELKTLQLPQKAPLDQKLHVYRTKLLPRHPAIFSEWFLKTYPDPTSWYNARLAYCRTTAVMSMVGYILGLGDRHGENILIDSTTGDCVHVDFNCLFNKGETFDYPEIVPFRLTHNMVEAMGLLGYEGIFRRSCEVTLRVMRDQTDPLMSVLKTFVYDPLVEWSKPPKGRSNPMDSGEIRNEKAQTHVHNIEDRLRGILKNKTKLRGLPLSVEGDVSRLIKEATDENNLCQMYIGWAAYM